MWGRGVWCGLTDARQRQMEGLSIFMKSEEAGLVVKSKSWFWTRARDSRQGNKATGSKQATTNPIPGQNPIQNPNPVQNNQNPKTYLTLGPSVQGQVIRQRSTQENQSGKSLEGCPLGLVADNLAGVKGWRYCLKRRENRCHGLWLMTSLIWQREEQNEEQEITILGVHQLGTMTWLSYLCFLYQSVIGASKFICPLY